MTQSTRKKGLSIGTSFVLIAIVIGLAMIPFFLAPNAEFRGADAAAAEVIVEISPTTRPWFQPLWTPPGSEMESLLFALQAVLGASVIGYFFGLKQGQRRKATDSTATVTHHAQP